MRSTTARLMCLYPKPWRERYGEELLELMGDRQLTAQQAIDLCMGALDAWLSTDVRGVTGSARVAVEGGIPMTLKTMMVCDRQMRFTMRDAMVGAGVILLASVAFAALGVALVRQGWPAAGRAVRELGVTGAVVMSMPWWLMKGQPWKAQAVVVGTTLALMAAIGLLVH